MYDKIKDIPTSRDGKMVYGLVAAVMARLMLNQGIATLPENAAGATYAFLMCGVLLTTVVIAIVRYDTGRPLFEPINRD